MKMILLITLIIKTRFALISIGVTRQKSALQKKDFHTP